MTEAVEPLVDAPCCRLVDQFTGTVGEPDEEASEKETQLRWTGAWW